MAFNPASFEAARAHVVLEDCRTALIELQQNPRGALWRLRWCTALTLLRAVGHVIAREGRAPGAAPEFRAAAEDWWQELNRTKPEPAIFWHFIEDHRNALLKEYVFRAEQGVEAIPARFGQFEMGQPLAIHETTYMVSNGFFQGRDQRELVAAAIDWWDEQLDEINTQALTAVAMRQS